MLSRLSLAIAVLAGIYSARVNAQNVTCTRNYIVQPGDYCDGISAAQNVSTYQLASVNSGIINTACTNLFPGESICLASSAQDCTTVHVVVSGDICVDISTAAGIDIGTLLANNPNVNTDCSNIYPGEVLCIAGNVTSSAK